MCNYKLGKNITFSIAKTFWIITKNTTIPSVVSGNVEAPAAI